jgi:hypothetical protein
MAIQDNQAGLGGKGPLGAAIKFQRREFSRYPALVQTTEQVVQRRFGIARKHSSRFDNGGKFGASIAHGRSGLFGGHASSLWIAGKIIGTIQFQCLNYTIHFVHADRTHGFMKIQHGVAVKRADLAVFKVK